MTDCTTHGVPRVRLPKMATATRPSEKFDKFDKKAKRKNSDGRKSNDNDTWSDE